VDQDEVLATAGKRPAHPAGSPWRLVAGLSALNVLGYVDRQLLSAVAPLLIEDLGLSLAQIGLLLGISFMLVYAVGTLVVGVLADRWSRPRLMAGGLAAWSAATGLTGTATGFLPLALWRALVGIGEATVPATAVAMIGDRVPTRRVGLANGIFYAGIPVGFAISFALAGLVAPVLGWRGCFLGLGAAGLVAVGLLWRMADPPRRGVTARSPGGARGAVSQVGRALLARPALLLVILAGTLLVWASASSQHTITWLVRERGFVFQRAAFYSAGVLLLAGLTGSLGIGALTDRARRRRPGARLVALATLGGIGLAAALIFYRVAPGSFLLLPAWFLAQAWLLGWFGPLLAAIDEMAPAGSRAGVIGFGLLVINVVGVAGGPYVTGVIGDRYDLTTGLTWSLVPAAVGVVLVGLVGLVDRRG
jgi:MFS family permease